MPTITQLEADYLKQVNPFANFDIIEDDEPEMKPGKIRVVYYVDSPGVPCPYEYTIDDIEDITHGWPIKPGVVAFCYWYGTRPGDPIRKERCTILTAGREV